MDLKFPLFTALSLSFGFAASSLPAAPARTVDFRYGIPTWHLPLGIPDDWHKPMTDERGALLYDFGPGPYAQPKTTVELTVSGEPLTRGEQTWTEGPRFPAVKTTFKNAKASVELTTLAIAPDSAAVSEGRTEKYERLDGITGALGWAQPPEGTSPEFRNVAWGITRPVRYRIRVTPGATKRIMLGFAESYKIRLYDRTADMRVEGAPSQWVDLGLNAELNQPQVFLFEGTDTDKNGWLDISIMAPIGRDPNTTLATIAVYPAGTTLSRAELVAGSKNPQDRAELRIACGTEVRRQSPRVDLLHGTFTGEGAPTLSVKTGRALTAKDDGTLQDGDFPFVSTRPKATKTEKTADGWKLEFPAGTRDVSVYVLSGNVTASEVNRVTNLDWNKAVSTSRERWAKLSIPYGHITVADPAIQQVIDSALRTVYQARESINGSAQFNSSFSLYRGLWAGDANDIAELAATVGDSTRGRETLAALWSFQDSDGLIDELPPQRIFRGTPMVLLSMERDAQISGNWDFVKANWSQVRRGNVALRSLRESTLAHPELPYSGLFPPGFNDGGIIDITAEYSSVYWTMLGLEASQRMAKAIGEEKDAASYARFAQELRKSYEEKRQRDLRHDQQGNLYLPVRVAVKEAEEFPSVAQWAVVQSLAFGRWLPLDDDFARGTYAMLVASEKQGLPASTGWLPNGIWAGYGSLFGHLTLLMGHAEKTADQLYAIANHASPRGTWVEEQSLVGAPLKLAGDQPHCWAATMFVRLSGFMLAYDRDTTVHVLNSVPEEWLQAGAINRLDDWRTGAGSVTMALTVSADGKTATLDLNALKATKPNTRFALHLDSLTRAGFSPEKATNNSVMDLPANAPVKMTFDRR